MYISGNRGSRGEYTPIANSPIDNLDAEHVDIKCGYCYNRTKKIIFHIISVCMLGVPYLAVHWSITLKLFLLMTPSPLSTAETVLVGVSTYIYIQNKLISFNSFVF